MFESTVLSFVQLCKNGACVTLKHNAKKKFLAFCLPFAFVVQRHEILPTKLVVSKHDKKMPKLC